MSECEIKLFCDDPAKSRCVVKIQERARTADNINDYAEWVRRTLQDTEEVGETPVIIRSEGSLEYSDLHNLEDVEEDGKGRPEAAVICRAPMFFGLVCGANVEVINPNTE